jgi:flagellar motility protein MotE (MotC chaperone)
MLHYLQSRWMAAGVGGVLYLVTTVVTWPPLRTAWRHPHTAAKTPEFATAPSWNFKNAEVEQLVADLKEQSDRLADRQHELDEFASRLEAERQEILNVTQTVSRMQQEFDRNVARIETEEVANLKKLAKLYSAMTPEAASVILKELPDEQIVKIMSYMKDPDKAAIFESFSKTDAKSSKRVAQISERMRLVLPAPPSGAPQPQP